MSFLEDLTTKYNARFITATPLRVDFFKHELETSSKANNEAVKTLLANEHELLTTLPAGDLIHCKEGIILLTKDPVFPIKFFCAWKPLLIKKKSAIHAKLVWCDQAYRNFRVNSKPLAAYCLFDVLLPKYHIILSAEEHTADGEKLEKNQIKYAVAHGINVYVNDETNNIFSIEDTTVLFDATDLFWGYSPAHAQRLFIYSEKAIF